MFFQLCLDNFRGGGRGRLCTRDLRASSETLPQGTSGSTRKYGTLFPRLLLLLDTLRLPCKVPRWLFLGHSSALQLGTGLHRPRPESEMVVDQYGTIEDKYLVSIGCDEEQQHKGYDTRLHGWREQVAPVICSHSVTSTRHVCIYTSSDFLIYGS